jgi:O-methyltransferase domain
MGGTTRGGRSNRGCTPTPSPRGRDLAERFDFSDCRSVADIGGGSGGLIAALCRAYPSIRGVLFELPRVATLARGILATEPGGEGVEIEAETSSRRRRERFSMPSSCVQSSRSSGRMESARAVANAASAIRPGGLLYIVGGGILDNDRLGPPMAVFLNGTFLNLYPEGASHTEAQYAEWLAAAGCGAHKRLLLASGGGLLRAQKLA